MKSHFNQLKFKSTSLNHDNEYVWPDYHVRIHFKYSFEFMSALVHTLHVSLSPPPLAPFPMCVCVFDFHFLADLWKAQRAATVRQLVILIATILCVLTRLCRHNHSFNDAIKKQFYMQCVLWVIWILDVIMWNYSLWICQLSCFIRYVVQFAN